VNDPECGAITTFIGTTRDNYQGKKVTKLSYEAYKPMAQKELLKLCQQASTKYDLKKIAALHVVGDCPVGRPSVLLACSSPHRRDALEAIEYLIDTLKATVPVWKFECYEDDDSIWKENIEWRDGKQHRVMVKTPQQTDQKQRQESLSH
jgi:molybdopterin synthase catalytic subunit